MPKAPENELKYVLHENFNENALVGWKRSEIKQGYLSDGWRLRDESGYLTRNLKTFVEGQLEPDEDEYEISQAEFNNDWPKTNDRLVKTRYKLDIDDEEWVIDFFKDENGKFFIMAEVEMPEGRITPNHIPNLIRDNCIHEVKRNDERFFSKNIADKSHAAEMIYLIHSNQI